MSRVFTIGDYVSENFIFVNRAGGIVKFTNEKKNEKTVFKFVIDSKKPLQSEELCF